MPMYGQTAANRSALDMSGGKAVLQSFKRSITCILAITPTHCQKHSAYSTQDPKIETLIMNFLEEITCEMIQTSLTEDVAGLADAVIDIIANAAFEQWIKMTMKYQRCYYGMRTSIVNILKSGSIIAANQLKGTESNLLDKDVLMKSNCKKCGTTFIYLSPEICASLDITKVNLPEFVMAVLHSMKQINLERSKVNNHGAILEAVWQKEFYRAATAILPSKMHITPELTAIKGDKMGRVDFTVETWEPDNTFKIKWCIELVRNGDKLDEHVQRFQPNGIYSDIGHEDHIIVDFRDEKSVYSKEALGYDRVWFVKHSLGCSTMEVMKVVLGGRATIKPFKVIRLPFERHEQCSLRETINHKCKDYEIKKLKSKLN